MTKNEIDINRHFHDARKKSEEISMKIFGIVSERGLFLISVEYC